MTIETIFIIALPSIIITAGLYYIIFNNKIRLAKERYRAAFAENIILKEELKQEKQFLLEAKNDIVEYKTSIAQLSTTLAHTRDKFEEYRNDLASQDERFKNLANDILEEKSKSFDAQQLKGIQHVLAPLQEKIKHFADRVDKTNTDSLKRHESLKEQIRFLSEHSDRVAADANNLAKALKGDFKKQGNWGEMVLESILEKSGLEKGREYHKQISEKDDDGKQKRPDVVIDLPDGKKIIVDSKVSLRAYDAMVAAEEEENFFAAQKAHVAAIKKHIDGLSNKNYQNLYKMESPDFVLMFIPIDTAFSAALQGEPTLYQYSFDRNVIIVTASTLLATLKTVESIWRNNNQNRYALEIASEAGKMYDKFVGFTEDMQKIGTQLNTVKNTYNDSLKKLSTGSGNLVKKAEKLKQLGAKATKQLVIAN